MRSKASAELSRTGRHTLFVDPRCSSEVWLTWDLAGYLVPTATQPLPLITRRTTTPAPGNPLGVKGTGEAGCIGAPPAILNAVYDALRDDGVTSLDLPLTPARVWEAIRSAR